jgi:hypothetical protein
MRVTVNDVLGWLAHGMTEEEILEEHPGLEKEDFTAAYAFAADIANGARAVIKGETSRGLTLRFEFKVALYSWLFALGSGAGVGIRGSISSRVAAL